MIHAVYVCFEVGPYRKGTRAKCQYKGDKYYECTLDSKDEEGNWTVNWADNDSADRTGHPEEHFNEILEVGPNPNDPVIQAFFFSFC